MQHTARPTQAKGMAWLHWLLVVLLAAAFALVLAEFFGLLNLKSGWPEATLLLLAVTGTIVSLTRQLPLQNVLLAASVIAIVGGGISALGAITGIPFGPFTFTAGLEPKIFNTLPWAMPLIWVVAILNSRGTARLILRPWRKTKTYGFWLIGLTATLVLLFDLAFDPFASRVKHFWLWSPTKFPLAWQGAPPVNFLSWGFVTLLILVLVTPALINKQLSKRRSPDFHPLCIWLGSISLFGIAAGMNGLWSAGAVDAAIGIVALIFAVRGARW
jgi:bisanhydrobacterioruberin hydratase